MPSIRVLQLGDICNVPWVLSQWLNKTKNIESTVVAFREHKFKYKHDVNLNVDRFPRVLQPAYRLSYLLTHLKDYDIFHMHAASFLPYYADAPLLKSAGKKLVYHFHGHDVYQRIFHRTGYTVTRKKAGFLTRLADWKFISTPDMFDAVPDAEWLPNPVDVSAWKYSLPEKDKGTITVFHAPTDRNKKGTEFVIEAVNALRKKKVNIRLDLVEGVSDAEFKRRLAASDIVLDQLMGGWYGVLSLEALCAGKPVIVYVREDLLHYMPFNPFQLSSHKNVGEKLEELATDASLRRKLSKLGLKYVNSLHHPKVVASKAKRVYEKIT